MIHREGERQKDPLDFLVQTGGEEGLGPPGGHSIPPPLGRKGLARTCSPGWDVLAWQALGLEGSLLPVHRDYWAPTQSFRSIGW